MRNASSMPLTRRPSKTRGPHLFWRRRESHDHWPPRLPEPRRQAVPVARVVGVGTGAGHVVRWVCMTHAARAPTTLHGAAGRILLIMVPLGAMTLVQQLVLHILRAPSATARDDRSWVHDAPCRAAAPPVHSERSADVRRASECDRVVHVAVSFACGACVCRRRAIGGSEARETGCRRCRASPGNAQHLHFVACEGVELPEVPGRVSVEARAVSRAIGCVLGDRGGDQVEHDGAGAVGGRERSAVQRIFGRLACFFRWWSANGHCSGPSAVLIVLPRRTAALRHILFQPISCPNTSGQVQTY